MSRAPLDNRRPWALSPQASGLVPQASALPPNRVPTLEKPPASVDTPAGLDPTTGHPPGEERVHDLRRALGDLEGEGSADPEARSADGTDLHPAFDRGPLGRGAMDLDKVQGALRELRALARTEPEAAEKMLRDHPKFARALRGSIQSQPATNPWS